MNTNNIALVDLKRQYATIAADLESEAVAVLRSCNYVSGARVAGFMADFARMHETQFGIGLSTGTDALHLALWALDIGHGDEVIVPANTYIATAEGVSLTGARVVLADHDEYYNLDVQDLDKRITPRTKAVIAVNLYGQPAQLDAIQRVCDQHHLVLIEDCAQAHLARYQGRSVGSFGRVGCFSFYPGKNLGACGEAGAVITNDAALHERMRRIHQHGVTDNKYHHWEPGHNYRMEELQAALLHVKLRHLPEWTRQRRANAHRYTELLKGVAAVQCPRERAGTECAYHLYVVQAQQRDALSAYLKTKGIATGLHYPTPLHLQPAYASLGHKIGDFPMAERCASQILSLPMFPELTPAEVELICKEIRNFYAGQSK
jgi:dTDP-4-amino-4,6-dideoxygalactose transaminase